MYKYLQIFWYNFGSIYFANIVILTLTYNVNRMKNLIYKNYLAPYLSKGVMAILGGITLISCGAMMDGYTETDGIYYDPNTDKIEQKIAWQEPQQEVYNHETGIIGQSQKIQKQQNERYNNKNWGNNQQISTSDWGTYTGTYDTYQYNTWGYPYYNSFYSPYYFGSYNSYFGNYFSWNMSYHWGYPWGYNYYSPYHYGYYNYWGGMYNPWYGYYSPYYRGYYGYRGYRQPYYYNNYPTYRNRTTYRRSGVNNGNYSPSNYETPRYGTGFRTAPQRHTTPNNTPSTRNNGNTRVFRSVPNDSSFNNSSSWRSSSNSTSSSSGTFRSSGTTTNSTRSGSNSGFRSGGFR